MSGDTLIMRCSICRKPKPNDAAWARPADPCCSGAVWTSSVTVVDTPEGPVAYGDISYGIDAEAARGGVSPSGKERP